jgi:lysophospholipase L1-like esterase
MAIGIKNNETILFIGDSITDCGRISDHRPLGNGYVQQFHDLVIAREPAKKIIIINRGVSGNRIQDLQNRWTDDVLGHRPQWLSVKIGINDLHGYLFGASAENAPKYFEQAYEEVLSRTKKQLPACGLLLVDPFYISRESSKASPRRAVLQLIAEYIKVVHKMSRRYKTRLVKTHDIFQKCLKTHDPDLFCPEPVHPNATGHAVIANEIYAKLSKGA